MTDSVCLMQTPSPLPELEHLCPVLIFTVLLTKHTLSVLCFFFLFKYVLRLFFSCNADVDTWKEKERKYDMWFRSAGGGCGGGGGQASDIAVLWDALLTVRLLGVSLCSASLCLLHWLYHPCFHIKHSHSSLAF